MHEAASVDLRVWLAAKPKATLGSHTKAKKFNALNSAASSCVQAGTSQPMA